MEMKLKFDTTCRSQSYFHTQLSEDTTIEDWQHNRVSARPMYRLVVSNTMPIGTHLITSDGALECRWCADIVLTLAYPIGSWRALGWWGSDVTIGSQPNTRRQRAMCLVCYKWQPAGAPVIYMGHQNFAPLCGFVRPQSSCVTQHTHMKTVLLYHPPQTHWKRPVSLTTTTTLKLPLCMSKRHHTKTVLLLHPPQAHWICPVVPPSTRLWEMSSCSIPSQAHEVHPVALTTTSTWKLFFVPRPTTVTLNFPSCASTTNTLNLSCNTTHHEHVKSHCCIKYLDHTETALLHRQPLKQ